MGLREIVRGESTIDFVGKFKTWLTISAILLAASLVGLLVRKLNLGLSFKGGTSISSPVRSNATIPDIRAALEEAGLPDAEVQIARDSVTGTRQVLVQSKHVDTSTLTRVQDELLAVAGLTDRNEINIEDVGPKWGRQISNKALQGLAVFLVLVIAYISLRFEPKMAVGAIIAVFHDLLVTTGIYALIGFEVSPATVVAVLTILGYSLYDTVVIFDKIRENASTVGGPARVTYSEMVNKSVNLVAMRSINTSLTSLIPVAALLIVGQFFVGAEQLKDLSLALFIGIFVGTYSSPFLAAPLLAVWKEREPRYAAIRSRQARSPVRTPALATSAGPIPDVIPDGEAVASAPAPASRGPYTARQALSPRGRKRKRGKRKR